MGDDAPTTTTTPPAPEWVEVPRKIRHIKPRSTERHTSCGFVRTDEDGVVTHIAGKLGRPVKLAPGGQPCKWELNAAPPEAEDILALGGQWALLDEHPTPADAEAAEATESALEAAKATAGDAGREVPPVQVPPASQEPVVVPGSADAPLPGLGAQGEGSAVPAADAVPAGSHVEVTTGPDGEVLDKALVPDGEASESASEEPEAGDGEAEQPPAA